MLRRCNLISAFTPLGNSSFNLKPKLRYPRIAKFSNITSIFILFDMLFDELLASLLLCLVGSAK